MRRYAVRRPTLLACRTSLGVSFPYVNNQCAGDVCQGVAHRSTRAGTFAPGDTVNTSRYAICRSSPKSGAHGFTLIELLIVVLIVAAMAAFANATYTQYITKSRRAAAAAFVMGVANRQE